MSEGWPLRDAENAAIIADEPVVWCPHCCEGFSAGDLEAQRVHIVCTECSIKGYSPAPYPPSWQQFMEQLDMYYPPEVFGVGEAPRNSDDGVRILRLIRAVDELYRENDRLRKGLLADMVREAEEHGLYESTAEPVLNTRKPSPRPRGTS